MDTLNALLKSANEYSGLLSAVIAAALFIWPIYQWFQVRRQDAEARRFTAYHQVVKNIVQSDDVSVSLRAHRQCAAIYELRNFKPYYPITHRIIKSLEAHWAAAAPEILCELRLTREFIEKNKGRVQLDA